MHKYHHSFKVNDADSTSAIRKPKLKDLLKLLEEKSPNWYDIGRGLGVSFHVRESLSHDVFALLILIVWRRCSVSGCQPMINH